MAIFNVFPYCTLDCLQNIVTTQLKILTIFINGFVLKNAHGWASHVIHLGPYTGQYGTQHETYTD